jgi:uncharacterized protein (DUF433 family)
MSIAIVSESIPLDVDQSGVIRVAHTRVTLDTVVYAFLDGATAEDIAQRYPSLDLADIYAVLGYYLRHRPEIESYLRRRRREATKVRRQNEHRLAPQGLRARLLARRHKAE